MGDTCDSMNTSLHSCNSHGNEPGELFIGRILYHQLSLFLYMKRSIIYGMLAFENMYNIKYSEYKNNSFSISYDNNNQTDTFCMSFLWYI